MACCQNGPSCCEQVPGVAGDAEIRTVLVGNPNCGKTTLFNALTGTNQRIGNWPGVTVECKSGKFKIQDTIVEVIDLPGIYSLTHATDTAIDGAIACDYVTQHNQQLYINITDASNLERHLYLTTQLLEMGLHVILVLNMMDVAERRNIQIDVDRLKQALACPVIVLEANKGVGVKALKQAIIQYDYAKNTPPALPYADAVQSAIRAITAAIPSELNHAGLALHLLEDDLRARKRVSADVLATVAAQQQHIQTEANEDADILIADARYQYITQVLKSCVTQTTQTNPNWTKRIDRILLNRVVGIPIFLFVMYCLFLFSINIGGAFQDFFDISSQTIFVDGFAHLLASFGAPTWLIVLLANGLGKGINTTVTFIPVIGAMFFFLALLEDSGYMARAAFVIDRFMRALGLPGKAFVPMIVGFGCNVPAVMAARNLENKRDRILTIMMIPFMSCGARLAIFAVFTAAFFPHGGQNIVFALYLIGILVAVFTGFLLRKTILKGESAPLVMELPLYHFPHFKTICLHAWQRLKMFVFRAGKLIVPICVLIGALNSLNVNGTINSGEGDTASLLSMIGHWMTPIFAPMGIHAENWPATVGLVTGVLAKEVVIGTLNTLYTQMGHLAAAAPESFHFWGGLKSALLSIPENFAQLGEALSNPVLAKAPIDPVNKGVYGLMYKNFDGKVGAFAYLLFILLYFPCVSTMAAMLRELHRGWAIFSGFWVTGVAYGVAVTFYQVATFAAHPFSSLMWVLSVGTVFIATIVGMRWYAEKEPKMLGQRV